MFIIVWAIEEYKNFDTFEVNAATASVVAYDLKFDDYKKKVIKAYPCLDLHYITMLGKVEEEEEESAEEGEIAREKVAREGDVDEDVIEVPAPIADTVEILVEMTTPTKA